MMRAALASLIVVMSLAGAARADEYGPSPPPPQPEPQPHPPPPDGDEMPPPPPPVTVSKWNRVFIGGFVGLGTIHASSKTCDSTHPCDEYDGLSVGLDLGVPMGKSRKLAIVGDLWVNAGGSSDARAGSAFALGAGVRWWPRQQVWLEGTLALGTLTEGPKNAPAGDLKPSGGLGLDLSIGVELAHWTHLALDLRPRLGLYQIGKNADIRMMQTGVLIGLTWY
jgi:hypothetical protein